MNRAPKDLIISTSMMFIVTILMLICGNVLYTTNLQFYCDILITDKSIIQTPLLGILLTRSCKDYNSCINKVVHYNGVIMRCLCDNVVRLFSSGY